MTDEGVLDPWVAQWMKDNPDRVKPMEELDPELLELARGDYAFPVTREMASVDNREVEGVPVRIYRPEGDVSGAVSYFHGGGFVIGSIGIMDNVAREIAHGAGAVVVSVGYRLAPENPYPAGLDDCETVTRWLFAHREELGLPAAAPVAVAGESAGGNLAAALSLRLRDRGAEPLAGQVLIYPGVAGTEVYPSRREFDGLIISLKAGELYWQAYSAGRDLEGDPYAVPLGAQDLANLPPALVLLGGCDMLRDEGRAYAARMREAGVDVEEVCYPGQPHGFVNLEFPAAAEAFERTGSWLRRVFSEHQPA